MSDNAGLDAAAVTFAAIAASNAAEAARKADRAERLAFVKGFRHDRASLEERRYYADSVYILWPQEEEGHSSVVAALIALCLIGAGIGGWIAWSGRQGVDFWLPLCFGVSFGAIGGAVAFGALAALGYLAGAVWPRVRRHWILLVVLAFAVGGIGGNVLWTKRKHDAAIERQSAYIDALPRCPDRASQVTEDCMRDSGLPFFMPRPIYHCPRAQAAILGCDPGRDGDEIWQPRGAR